MTVLTKFLQTIKRQYFFRKVMIGKGYLLILFMVTTIVMLSNINANAQISGKWSADLQPRLGSNATGTATLELQNNGENVQYSITGSGLSNVTGIVISQEMGSGRAPDVVTLKLASQSGIGPGAGSLSGSFTKSDLIGPLKDKDIADFVKAINDGKIIFRVSTMAFPLGEIIGNVTAGAGIATGTAMNATANATGTAMNATANATGTAMNATANATGTTMNATANATGTTMNATANATGTTMTQPESVVSPAANATANATGTTMTQPESVVSPAANATANATGTTMTQPETVVSTAANATANATGTAMDKANAVVSTAAIATKNATQTGIEQAKSVMANV